MKKSIYTFFLIIISLILTGCVDTNKEKSYSLGLKYKDNFVESIGINSSRTEFSVVGSAVNMDVSYKIVFVSELGRDDTEIYLEELDNNGEAISKKAFKVLDKNNYIYEGTIVSGEVAYGKRFRLIFNNFEIIDTINSYSIELYK